SGELRAPANCSRWNGRPCTGVRCRRWIDAAVQRSHMQVEVKKMSTRGTEIDNADAQVLGADGEFHVTDEPVDLSVYRFEDWLAFGFFWVLALTVFYQFFTRYVLND